MGIMREVGEMGVGGGLVRNVKPRQRWQKKERASVADAAMR